MRFAHVRRGRAEEPPGILGVARTDIKTKVLVRRLGPGDIAIIDHPDLDRVSADELIACRVAAVVNASRSVTGRYPNLGPRLLVEAGIPVVDDAGKEVLTRVAEGAVVRLDKDILYNDSDQVIAKGVLLTEAGLAAALDDANAAAATRIDAFAENTLEFLRRERDLLTNGIRPPELATAMRGRHVLVVVRGYRYRQDLRALRPYIREYRPVLVAVDGGADALLEAGYQPDVIIGDMDSVSDEALAAGAELVVHAYPDGRAPGMERLAALGLDGVPLPAPGTSEDVALLVADGCGASLIAVVGTHWTLEEFLDKGRPGMASTFLTHLRVGSKLVNARGVHQLYQSRISGWALAALVVAAAVTVVVAIAYSPAGPILGNYLSATWHTFGYWFTGLFK
ncbi:MAG TPA: putative cytokinetic ring protein SteA [Trebonia sp.]